jgi:diguanylate cyclase (GGDEF)-like protein
MKTSGSLLAWPVAGWKLPAWKPALWMQKARDFVEGYQQPVLGEARVIDDQLVGERLRSGERFAELFRWSFIIIFVLMDMFQPAGGRYGQVEVFGLLLAWAAVNLLVTVLLLRGFRPNRWFCYATSGVDIALASALVGVTGGLASPFYLVFFLAILSSAMRFGLVAAVFTSMMVSFLYVFVGGYVTTLMQGAGSLEDLLGHVSIFMLVGTMTGLMSQELIRERQVAIGKAAEKDALQNMHNEMTATINLDEVLGVVLRQALRIVGGLQGRIVIVNAESGDVQARDASGSRVLVLDDFNWTVEKAKSRLLGNGRRLLAPIPASYSEDLILLDLYAKRGFSPRQFDMVAQLAHNAASPVNNSLRYLSKETEATTDSLTGMVNQREMRRVMRIKIKRCEEGRNQPFSVMLIDIDRFKQINDTRGHEYGNEVLVKAAALITKTMRSHDVVVRYGGDEMAVVLDGAGVAEADQAAERMLAAIRAAAIPGEEDKPVSFSIGVATYPEHAESLETLIEAADQGLYLVKRGGRNGASRLRTKAELAAAPLETGN